MGNLRDGGFHVRTVAARWRGRKVATAAARWRGSEGAGGGSSKLEVPTAAVAGGGWTQVREDQELWTECKRQREASAFWFWRLGLDSRVKVGVDARF